MQILEDILGLSFTIFGQNITNFLQPLMYQGLPSMGHFLILQDNKL